MVTTRGGKKSKGEGNGSSSSSNNPPPNSQSSSECLPSFRLLDFFYSQISLLQEVLSFTGRIGLVWRLLNRQAAGYWGQFPAALRQTSLVTVLQNASLLRFAQLREVIKRLLSKDRLPQYLCPPAIAYRCALEGRVEVLREILVIWPRDVHQHERWHGRAVPVKKDDDDSDEEDSCGGRGRRRVCRCREPWKTLAKNPFDAPFLGLLLGACAGSQISVLTFLRDRLVSPVGSNGESEFQELFGRALRGAENSLPTAMGIVLSIGESILYGPDALGVLEWVRGALSRTVFENLMSYCGDMMMRGERKEELHKKPKLIRFLSDHRGISRNLCLQVLSMGGFLEDLKEEFEKDLQVIDPPSNVQEETGVG
eukprot:Cvel_9603.t1-p1 / transcript=Cvel_9603.t1 / gene=Cvel_9603 / organism=Chromera_velia_CCMP2878 / gene_product=hypothetical protein / transcript_product=hypothetical protein / location=Cvel_scaffold558:1-1098(-) / protein_length=366 / sequence_SO=supercontig / SO=protein_coding / is_pseudo=false